MVEEVIIMNEELVKCIEELLETVEDLEGVGVGLVTIVEL